MKIDEKELKKSMSVRNPIKAQTSVQAIRRMGTVSGSFVTDNTAYKRTLIFYYLVPRKSALYTSLANILYDSTNCK